MRLAVFLLLLYFFMKNFVLLYMILETMEFIMVGQLFYLFYSYGVGASVVVLYLYILVSLSITCFILLIRVFSSKGKNNFFL